MKLTTTMQASRYEYKYLISERVARHVREYTQGYLDPDPYTRDKEGSGYPVHSLYLDSRDLLTCRATQCGWRDRFKLRIRFYDDLPASPVFFEIKQRIDQVIRKQRALVARASVPDLLAGVWPRSADLVSKTNEDYRSLVSFSKLRDTIRAHPTAYTSYMREGYEAPNSNHIRVTFDRVLCAGKFRGKLSVADLSQWERPNLNDVVLELKFMNEFPTWMHTMAQEFNLMRTSVPKYVICITHLKRWPIDVPIVVE